MDGGGENNHVGSEELLDQSDWDGSGLINDQKLSLSEGSAVLGSDILDSLSMVAVDVNSHDSVVEFRVGTLKDLIVGVLLIVESIEAFENELKNGDEIFRRRCCHENVTESVDNSTRESDTKGSRLSSTTSSSQTDGALKGLLRNIVYHLHDAGGLVKGAA
jgi:hypothetical protein